MRLPFQIALYPVRFKLREPEFLLLLRNKRRGGFWQGVTGGLKAMEDFKAAAERELKEETALKPLAVYQIDFTYSYPIEDQWKHLYTDDDTNIVERVFVAIVESDMKPSLSSEHVDYRWCQLEEAISLLNWEQSIEGIKKCNDFVRYNWINSSSNNCF